MWSGPIRLKCARKIWSNLAFARFARKLRRKLASWCSQTGNFFPWTARMFGFSLRFTTVRAVGAKFSSWKQKLTLETIFAVWQNWETLVNMHSLCMFLQWHASSSCWHFIETDARKNSLQKVTAKSESQLETWRILLYYHSTFRACQTCMAAIG